MQYYKPSLKTFWTALLITVKMLRTVENQSLWTVENQQRSVVHLIYKINFSHHVKYALPLDTTHQNNFCFWRKLLVVTFLIKPNQTYKHIAPYWLHIKCITKTITKNKNKNVTIGNTPLPTAEENERNWESKNACYHNISYFQK